MEQVSILERVIEQVPGSSHPSPFPLDELIEIAPLFNGKWFDIGRRAIEILSDRKEIQQFTEQYITFIQEKEGTNNDLAEKTAYDVLGYATGYVDDEQANKWFSALPNLKHPIMGRERPFMKGKLVGSYLIICRTDEDHTRNFLLTEVPSLLEPAFKVAYLEGKDNPSYFAFEIIPPKEGIMSSPKFGFMYLSGIIRGLQLRLKDDMQRDANLSLDARGLK